MLATTLEIPQHKKTLTLNAILTKTISYKKLNERIIIKKNTKILVDTKRSIALLNNGDHIDICKTEYSLYL